MNVIGQPPEAEPCLGTRPAQVGKQDVESEMEFTLKLSMTHPRKEQPRIFTLRLGQVPLIIGRGKHCNFNLDSKSVSTEHLAIRLEKGDGRNPKLRIEDRSTNKTGLRRYRARDGDRADDLDHLSTLIIPLNGPRDHTQFQILVEFCLPDAYCNFSKTGRWEYLEKLGEGGLANVYRAKDRLCRIKEDVAIKVSKFFNTNPISPNNRHIYSMHREAQWSLQRLHNPEDARYHPDGASLFVKYLEDHTGLEAACDGEFNFDAARECLECPSFKWREEALAVSHYPYIVMELLNGQVLQEGIDNESFSNAEKKLFIRQCVEAVCYMERFGLIHRDYRVCNLFTEGHGLSIKLKVIDLGFMISTETRHVWNANIAVRIKWSRQTVTAPIRSLYDWAPPEVRSATGAPNFGIPGSSFDVFSLGVTICKLLKGRQWATKALSQGEGLEDILQQDWATIGLTGELVKRMLHQDPGRRPRPCHLLLEVTGFSKLEDLWNSMREGKERAETDCGRLDAFSDDESGSTLASEDNDVGNSSRSMCAENMDMKENQDQDFEWFDEATRRHGERSRSPRRVL